MPARCCSKVVAGQFVAVAARAVLLATGGGARMYRISSPSLEKSGDGMAMAWRAGAAFSDTEMLQFHPTGLLVGKSIATGGLLEEGLRGAGALLINGLGERFMERYDPKLERATRDVVSRSSYIEIMEGRGTRTAVCGSMRAIWAKRSCWRTFPVWWSVAPTTASTCSTTA